MAPQPLSRVRPNAYYSFGIDTLQAHPELTAIVMQTVSSISLAENARGKLLALFLGADTRVGVAMYNALTGATAQKAAIFAAASAALSDEDMDILNKIDRIAKPSFENRNDYVHKIWGESKEIPNALLLIDGKFYADKEDGNIPSYVAAQLISRENINVYSRSELRRQLES